MKTGRKVIDVFCFGKKAGTLAETRDGKVAFEYDGTWIEGGFSLNPFSLPLQKGVAVPSKMNFDGLFGIFADSLPDAWGNALLDRVLKKNGVEPQELSVLDRLAIAGSDGKGALEYVPQYELIKDKKDISLDAFAGECERILSNKESESLDVLFRMGGSSGGARPKAYYHIDGEEWIVKFPYTGDMKDSGVMEYEYSLCAKKCGIDMMETKLFESEICSGYFGTKRFDRPKKHMASVAALLELDFELPSLDYADLFKLTRILTASEYDKKQMYRRMCFNVHAVNMDDHAKNFTYIFDESKGIWRLAPAYDLTYIVTGYGEHTTAINGKGKEISGNDLADMGVKAGLDRKWCMETNEEIENMVHEELGKYVK